VSGQDTGTTSHSQCQAIQVLSVVVFSSVNVEMHLKEATKNIKMDNSQAALMEINMTRQAMTLAGLKLNATVMCSNLRNKAYCVTPDHVHLLLDANPREGIFSIVNKIKGYFPHPKRRVFRTEI